MWSFDFVEGRIHVGRKFRILSIIDQASRKCLPVARRLRSENVLAERAEPWPIRLSACSSPHTASRIVPRRKLRVLDREGHVQRDKGFIFDDENGLVI